MLQALQVRARRMSYSLFSLSLNNREYRFVFSFGSPFDFWQRAQVSQ
jgi:hypothetical protein